MQLIPQWTFSKLGPSLVILTLALTSQGCSSFQGRKEKPNDKIIIHSANQRVYAYPYDSVWRACQLALKYPIAINNMDNGLLETDWIKAADGYQPPDATKEPSAGLKYKISMSLVKGKLDNKESVRATLSKKIEKQRDFFAEPEPVDSDGLEEKIIFYRIEREILIDEGLKKAAKLQSH